MTAFQSTPPVKAATAAVGAALFTGLFQSTPPVKAATFIQNAPIKEFVISIHAAREGGDRIV